MRNRCPFAFVLALAAVLLFAIAAAFAQAPAAQPVASPAAKQDRLSDSRTLGLSDVKAQPSLLGDETDGSRARPVHAIPLRDTEGEVIRPTDRPLLPFSPVRTCGADCHDVTQITRGWHFNLTGPRPGDHRRSQPWILVDPETATQLPLSYRPTAGAFHPEQVGITPFVFASMFGGRTPGGITGAREPGVALRTRWVVSGELEVNCLACHDASPAYDHAEYGRQLRLDNFRWAPSAASGLAAVTGSAKEMPNTFDYLMPFVEDALSPRMPTIAYAADRFLPGAKMVFDIAREVPNRRCYFCHSNADIAHTGRGRWNADEDIHLARGMTCVDCHRNGLDHAMTRGYEGEQPNGHEATALTCRGCHLATEPERNFARGRFGAPYPKHAGIPPIHFTKLSCTACHSGPRPEQTTRGLKTSQAHRLGGLGVNKAAQVLPHLYYPVFAEQPDGTTTPNRMVWPAFWGRLADGTVRPIAPDVVRKVMAKAKVTVKVAVNGGWSSFDEAKVARVLASFEAGDGTPVYVAGGRLHRLNAQATLVREEHASAQPYLWPMAHDVRPAALALGARGCTDCHDRNAPIFFGKVAVDSPLVADGVEAWTMHRFQKSLDKEHVAAFADSFRYRPWLKAGVSAAASILTLFVLAYVMSGVQRLSAATRGQRWKRMVANLVGAGCMAASIATGLPSLLSGEAIIGPALMLHVTMAPAFAAGAVLVALFWSERNSLGRVDWDRVCHPIGRSQPGVRSAHLVVLRKLAFWVALGASIPAVVSVTAAMFPVLPSVYQHALILAHRYSVALLTVASLLFAVLALSAWLLRSEERVGAAALAQSSGPEHVSR